MKEYVKPEIEVVEFETEDIIVTSINNTAPNGTAGI